jgi:hypothetical protein
VRGLSEGFLSPLARTNLFETLVTLGCDTATLVKQYRMVRARFIVKYRTVVNLLNIEFIQILEKSIVQMLPTLLKRDVRGELNFRISIPCTSAEYSLSIGPLIIPCESPLILSFDDMV